MKSKRTSRSSRTDFRRLAALTDRDIDCAEIPRIPPDRFAQAVVRCGLKAVPPKQQLTLRIDGDVVEWFKSQGRGYQTRINALLRAYMEAHGV